MTLPNPYATSASAAPPLGREQRNGLRPHRAWYAVGAAMLLLAVVLLTSASRAVLAIAADAGTPLRFIPSGVETRVELEAGSYDVMVEGTGRLREAFGIAPCDVTHSASQLTVAVRSVGPSSVTMTRRNEVYVAIANFTTGAAGEYAITCKVSRQTRLVLAREPTYHGNPGGKLLLGLLLGGGGLAILIVTAVRRSRAEQRLIQGVSAWPC